MKRTIFSFTAVLALIASLGFGLYPEPSLSQEVPAATVGWYKLPSGTSPLILASCWNPVEGELYIVTRGAWDLNNLWLGSFNALGDFNGWESIPRGYDYTDPTTGQQTGTITLGTNPSASMSWNTATQEMYLMLLDSTNKFWITTVNSTKPPIYTRYTVSGNVTDASQSPMSGVTIVASLNNLYVKSSTPTDNNGNYSLSLRGGFSYGLTAWRADKTQVGGQKTVPATGTGFLCSDQTVNFSAVPIVTYNLTVGIIPTNGHGGSVATPDPAGTVVSSNIWSYPGGTQVTLTAAPNAAAGYILNSWSGLVAADGDTSSGNTATVFMTKDKTITATFVTYNLTVGIIPNDGSGGTVATPSPAGAMLSSNIWSYTPGTEVTLTATPNTANGYSLSGWSGLVMADGDTSSGNTATVHMTNNKTITATFTKGGDLLTWGLNGYLIQMGVGQTKTYTVRIGPRMTQAYIYIMADYPNSKFTFTFTIVPPYSWCLSPGQSCQAVWSGTIAYSSSITLNLAPLYFTPQTEDGYLPPGDYTLEILWEDAGKLLINTSCS